MAAESERQRAKIRIKKQSAQEQSPATCWNGVQTEARPVRAGRRSLAPVRNLVILGCGGFIGSHLLDTLLDQHTIRIEGWDLYDDKIAVHLANPMFTFHREAFSDARIPPRLIEAVKSADAVINLAAICNPSQYNTNPLEVIRSNFLDVYRLVELCSHHGTWLVHFSTSEVYGRTVSSYLPTPDHADPDLFELEEATTPLIMGPIQNQRWSYACAKQMLERFIYAHHKERGLPYTIVRPLNFFGPKMDFIPGRDGEGIPRVLACFMTALLDRLPLQLVDGGQARRTIVSIHDAVAAIVLMLQKPDRAVNQIFNVGNRENEVTMAELAALIRQVYARVTGDPSYLSHPIVSVSSRDFYGEGYEDCDRRMPVLVKARELLGWVPRMSLYDTLLETVSYYYQTYGDAGTPTDTVELSRHTDKAVGAYPVKAPSGREFDVVG